MAFEKSPAFAKFDFKKGQSSTEGGSIEISKRCSPSWRLQPFMEEKFEKWKPDVSTVMGLIHHLTDLQGALNMKPNLDPQLPEQGHRQSIESIQESPPLEKVLGLFSQLGDFQRHLGRTRRDLGDSLEIAAKPGGGHLLEGLVGDDVNGLVFALVLVIVGLCSVVFLLLLLLCWSCRRKKLSVEEGQVEAVEGEEKGEEGRRKGRSVERKVEKKGRERKSRERRSRERRARDESQWTSESSETSPGGLPAKYHFPVRRPAGPPIWVPPSPENLNSSSGTPRSTGFQPIWHHSDSSGWCPGPPCGAQKILEPTSLL